MTYNRKRFHVTYDVVTPASAEHGDVDESGFIVASGDKVPLANASGPKAAAMMLGCALTLQEAAELVHAPFENGDGLSLYETDPRRNFRNGYEESRALHLPRNLTQSSAARVLRVLANAR